MIHENRYNYVIWIEFCCFIDLKNGKIIRNFKK